mmetsp:Transcript_11515/g.48346  ORF Transcript_11515/g.48346 Transcript_11515/m.48346 type:complete len:288 (+) Transcript_11515:1661-2524(+)
MSKKSLEMSSQYRRTLATSFERSACSRASAWQRIRRIPLRLSATRSSRAGCSPTARRPRGARSSNCCTELEIAYRSSERRSSPRHLGRTRPLCRPRMHAGAVRLWLVVVRTTMLHPLPHLRRRHSASRSRPRVALCRTFSSAKLRVWRAPRRRRPPRVPLRRCSRRAAYSSDRGPPHVRLTAPLQHCAPRCSRFPRHTRSTWRASRRRSARRCRQGGQMMTRRRLLSCSPAPLRPPGMLQLRLIRPCRRPLRRCPSCPPCPDCRNCPTPRSPASTPSWPRSSRRVPS